MIYSRYLWLSILNHLLGNKLLDCIPKYSKIQTAIKSFISEHSKKLVLHHSKQEIIKKDHR